MKLISKQKKAILLLYTYIIMLIAPKIHDTKRINFNSEYNITYNNLFAEFNGTNIYIENIKNNNCHTSSKNIYIYDNRNKNNPNMTIQDSHKIISIEDMINVLKIIKIYEKEYPSNWNRTTESMLTEWIVHNICYYLNFEQHRTKEVDLDNAEEIKYLNFLKTIVETLKTNSFNEIISSNNKQLKKK